ncbi:proline and serine-rich protein 3 isoform X5 [Paroedura picta]|uniref:proline and serine-rich protein 3 isoform X5 n=1 Tax=Paroedura picta TaxID=143630 RepID=UPI004055A428
MFRSKKSLLCSCVLQPGEPLLGGIQFPEPLSPFPGTAVESERAIHDTSSDSVTGSPPIVESAGRPAGSRLPFGGLAIPLLLKVTSPRQRHQHLQVPAGKTQTGARMEGSHLLSVPCKTILLQAGRWENLLDSFVYFLLQGESQDSSTLDPDTVSLQERATRLLHRSTSSSSSCRHASSEGLGCTPASTITNADADQIGQAPKLVVGHHHTAILGTLSCPIVQISPSHSSSRPEDDILFQWRLRRKMEEASKAAALLPSMSRAAPKTPEPTSWQSKDRTALPTSEAQLRHILDSHPYYCTDQSRGGPSSQPPAEGAPFSDQKAMLGYSEPNRTQGVKRPVPRKDPVPVSLDSLPSPEPAGVAKPLDLSPPNRSRGTARPVQKVYTEPNRRQCLFRTEQGRPKAPRDSVKPSVSPGKHIQHVLGEVVTERLFSSPDSPAPQRGQLKRNSKKKGLKESLPHTVAPPSYPELLSMAAQLLEQAEDSDGTDFEEDPLLQVLRSQRDRLRSQLRAVDAQVAQLSHRSNEDFSQP